MPRHEINTGTAKSEMKEPPQSEGGDKAGWRTASASLPYRSVPLTLPVFRKHVHVSMDLVQGRPDHCKLVVDAVLCDADVIGCTNPAEELAHGQPGFGHGRRVSIQGTNSAWLRFSLNAIDRGLQ